MKDLLLDDNDNLIISNGDFVIGNADYQQRKLIILSQKGEWKEYPSLGFGIDNYLKKSVTADEKQKFITELKSELSSDNIKDTVKIEGNDLSKFELYE
jgi:hypothetical protein